MDINMNRSISRLKNFGSLTPTWEREGWNPACLPITPPPERQPGLEDEDVYFKFPAAAAASTSEINLATEPLVAVIGVGYVGTHLVDSFSSVYNVIGFDVSERRVKELEAEFGFQSRARFTSCQDDLKDVTHFLISVPTLLRSDKTIDSSYLQAALETVSARARPGATVVVESSVAVGMTRQLLGPIAASHRFFAGMSPERVDPGRTDPPMRSIPKVVSGLDDIAPGSLDAITRLYQPVFDKIVRVSRPEVAEMMKLYENCQRMINIAFANEMANACTEHDIDPFEVSRAAASKPFGYMPYTPSIGVGGHCIPVNPYYLLSNCDFPLLRAATEKMWERPAEIARRITSTLLGGSKLTGSALQLRPNVLVVGMGFKAGQSVLSNSPSLELARALVKSDSVNVMYADPLVKQEAVPEVPRLADEDWNSKTLERFDMIIVAFKQIGMNFDILEGLRGVKVEMWCR